MALSREFDITAVPVVDDDGRPSESDRPGSPECCYRHRLDSLRQGRGAASGPLANDLGDN